MRDQNQVVSRQTRNQGTTGSGLSMGTKVIMVDQLWLCLWIVEKCDGQLHSSGVLTSFPDTTYSREQYGPPKPYDNTDIRRAVLRSLETDEGPRNAADVASLILWAALGNTIPEMRKEFSLDFLELFREAIGVVAQKQEEFQASFARHLGSNITGLKITQKIEEVQLGLEIDDIILEL